MNLLEKYIQSGALSGDAADRLLACNGDPNCLRPFIGDDGRSYITVRNQFGNLETQPIANTTATLRKDDWKILDDAIVQVSKERLRLVADLKAAGLTFTIPQGMGKTVLETETVGDVSDAIISMDGLRESTDDRPEFELGLLPLPIIHKDFQFSVRQILASRNGGSPIDTTTAMLSSRKVSEAVEKLALGRTSAYVYGGGTIYGMTNYTSVLTQVLTAPTAGGWTAATLLTEILAMRTTSVADFHYGPWMLYFAPSWDAYLDEDYNATSGVTLRERIKKVSGIMDIRTLDYMQNYDVVMLQMTSDVMRMIIGMDITTLQWDTKGGMQKNFKIMTIVVPQLRKDQNDNTGIVLGRVA